MSGVDAEAQAAIDSYLMAVRVALRGLPDHVRDELLEDLPAHFAEVLAERDGTLEDRLGPPQQYATELRNAAGFPMVRRQFAVRARIAPIARRAETMARRADAAIGTLIHYDRASDFVRLLAPAWLVLRGYVVALLLFWYGPFNANDFNDLVGWVVTLALIVLSVRIGPIAKRLPQLTARVPTRARIAIGSAVGVAVAVTLVNVSGTPYNPYEEAYFDGYDRWSQVTDVFPFSSDGRPLHDVVLYDQNGNVMQFGDYWRCVDVVTDVVIPTYPLCKGPRVTRSPSPTITPSPSLSPAASPSPSPSPSVAATGVPSPPG